MMTSTFNVICINTIRMPSTPLNYFTENNIYTVKRSGKLGRLKYTITDNSNAEWYYLGIANFFISLKKSRQLKLDKLNEKCSNK